MSFNPICAAFADGLAPDPYLTIDQWADKYRQLPKGASAEAGQYRTDRMPYLREVMQWLSPQDPTQQVKIIKATQLGFSETGNNAAMYYMDIVPTSQLMIMPTETLAKDHSNRKLTPSLRAMPYLAKRIGGGKTRDDIGGTFEKTYPGGMLKIAWAGSAANYRSLSIRFLNLDDVDGFPSDVDGEGDPLDLAKKRTDSFGILRKIYINSTPTIKGKSNIEIEYEDSDQRRYYMPCPHCTPLDSKSQNKENMVCFENKHFVFNYDNETYTLIGDVQFCCPHCGSMINEYEKSWMMDQKNGARTIPDNPGHIHKGLRIPSYYSPIGFLSWNEIYREKLTAKKAMSRGDIRKMKTWVNTRDAKTWEDEMDKVDISDAAARVEEYAAEVPDQVYILTAGVDAQDDRYEIEVVGWGKDGESWSIDYHVIFGDPALPTTKEALDEYRNRDFIRSDGSAMKIYASGNDTQGHRTDAVYAYCKQRQIHRVYALKGSSVINKPIFEGISKPTKGSKAHKAKIQLYLIGVNSAKNTIYGNLEITDHGPGYMHFPNKSQYNDRYFKMLTAERRKDNGIWEKYRDRNEAIDCRVYALAALHICGIDVDKLHEPILYIETTRRRKNRRIISKGIQR